MLQGLLTLKAAELAEEGTSPVDIVEELQRIRRRSGILFVLETLDRLLASGRVGKGRAWFGNVLGVRPILGLTLDGRVAPFGKAIGRRRAVSTLLRLVHQQVVGADKVRFGVTHVACPEVSAQVSRQLKARYGDVEVLEHPATPVIATHTGPGSWGVAYMIED